MTAPVPAGAPYGPPAAPFQPQPAFPPQQAPSQQPYPPARFSSQIPEQPTRLSHALLSEWTKIKTVRSTMWTLGVMLALVIGIDLLVIVPIKNNPDNTVPVLAPGLFGLLLGEMAILTLGVLVITSEYGTGMIRTTFTTCPKRSLVLAAKAVVFFVVSFVTTTLACAVTALISNTVVGGLSVGPDYVSHAGVVIKNGHTAASGSEWLGATVGAGLYVALLGLLALCVGTLLRHSAGAITAMIGVVLLPLIVALFMPTSLHSTRTDLIRYSAPNGLASLFHIPIVGDGNQNGVHNLVVLACVVAAALVAAFVSINARDV